MLTRFNRQHSLHSRTRPARRCVCPSKPIAIALLSLAVMAWPTTSAFATDHTWNGGSIFSDDWTDAGNWNGFLNAPPLSGLGSTRIFFNGAATGTTADLNNNFSINELQFSAGSGNKAFTLNSNSAKTLTIGSGGITNSMTSTQTINHAVSIGDGQNWSAVNGNLVINGSQTGGGLLRINANPGHSVTLGGDGSLHTGAVIIDKGTLIITHGAALGTGSETLLISGVISGVSTNAALLIGAPVVTNHDIRVVHTPAGSVDQVTIGTTNFNPGAVNSGFAGQLTIADNVVLQAGSTDRTTFSGKITGTGNLIVTSPFAASRRIVIDRPSGAANDFVGDVGIAANAVLQLGVANSIGNRTLPDTATIQFGTAGSTLSLAPAGSGDSETVGTLVSVTPGAGVVNMFTGTAFTLSIGGDGESGTFSGTITDSAGALTINKVGAGTQTLSGTNTHSGGTRLSAGTLAISADANLGTSNSPVTFAGGVLRINAGPVFDFANGRQFTIASGDATFDSQAGSDAAIVGGVSGSGGLIKNGSGALYLFSTGSTYTGSTTINGGQLSAAFTDELIPDSTDVIINAGFLTFQGGVTETIGSLSGGGTVGFNVDGGGHLRVGANNKTTTYAGNIVDGSGGSGRLTKIGGGTLTLTGNNTYSEGTTVSAGKLVVNTNSLPASKGVFNNATLEFNQTINGTYAGVISGMGPLIKTGGGTLTLNQTNTLNGAIEVHDGTLEVGSNTALGSAEVWMFGGGIRAGGAQRVLSNKLDIVGSFTLGRLTDFVGQITLNNPATIFIDNPDGPANAFSNLAAITQTGGARGLTIANGPLFGSGGGGIRLTGANTYTGGTTVNSGRLVVASTGALAATGAVTVNGGELKFENSTQTVSSLSGTGGSLVLEPTVLTVNQSAATTFAGNISGSGGLIKTGTGILTLLGNSTYAGATDIFNGTLAVNASVRVNTGSLNVSNLGSSLTTGDPIDLDGGKITANTLSIADGGNVTSRFGYVGATLVDANTISLSDRADISGAGSLWQTRFISIGHGNKGTVSVGDGGRVTTTANFSIGNTSDGDLNIDAGGVVDTGANATVGRASGLTGNVTVGTGRGKPAVGNATWNVAGSVYLGGTNSVAGGTGSLTVNVNGEVNVANIVKTWAGGTATVNGVLNATTIRNLGLLNGEGAINANVLNSEGGTVAPGNSPGRLSVTGDYTQDADSSLLIEIGDLQAGKGHDVLAISGTANLAGSLNVSLFDFGFGLFAPQAGDSFDILTATTLQGRFGTLNYATLGPNLGWHIAYLTDEIGTTDVVRLSVLAVPEPQAWAMMLAGLGLVGAMVRRRNQA